MSLFSTIITNLQNKLTFLAYNAATDPNANNFAETTAKEATENKSTDGSNEKEPPSTDGDPDSFSLTRFIKKIGSQMVKVSTDGLFPFMALILSMYVSNEMIMYSPIIRLVFFMFTFMICLIFVPFSFLLAGFYVCKAAYSYYVNNLSKGKSKQIMPIIFALLPLTTYRPITSIGKFFMYPFTYPKTESDAKQLPIIMNNYLESLKGSFSYYEKVQNLDFFVTEFKNLKEDMDFLHEIPKEEEEESLPPVIGSTNAVTNESNKQNASTLPSVIGSANTVANESNKQNASTLPPAIGSTNASANTTENSKVNATANAAANSKINAAANTKINAAANASANATANATANVAANVAANESKPQNASTLLPVTGSTNAAVNESKKQNTSTLPPTLGATS